MLRVLLLTSALLSCAPLLENQLDMSTDDDAIPSALMTVAESSGYTRTARHEEVLAQLDALAAASPLVRRGRLGVTFEGREIPWITVADPPVETAQEALASGKLVVFAFANIHAGEVCGKEALVRLAREIVLAPGSPQHAELLRRLVLVFAPIYNGDGNERFSTTNRPNQDGPAEGQGQRPNAQGLDLNRDSMKLESPEARAMAAFLTEWSPHLVFDLHTTNGSLHRYLLTYAPPLNPEGHPEPIAFVRERMLPEVSRRLLERTGYDTFFYGNYTELDGDPHGAWSTYSAQPRFGAQYHGLRGHMSILSEAYSHAPYRERVLATLEFMRECLVFAAEHSADMKTVVEQAWQEVARGLDLGRVGFRHRLASSSEPAVIRGWVESRDEQGRWVHTDEPRDYHVRHDDHFEASVWVERPAGYYIPAKLTGVLDVLRAHGVRMAHVEGATEAGMEVEVSRVDAVNRAETPFEGHHLLSLEVTTRREQRRFDSSWVHVPVDQPLGTLAVYLLEALSDDGLVAWNLLDEQLAPGEDYPILRLLRTGL